jgi:general secretion pathway protein D
MTNGTMKWPALLLALVLAACGSTPIERAQTLAREGRAAEALAVLDEATRQRSADPDRLRAERLQLQQAAVLQTLALAERARASGRLDEARALATRALQLDPGQPRAEAVLAEIERAERINAEVARAREDARNGRTAAARERLAPLLREQPSHAAARALMQQLQAAAAPPPLPAGLAEALRRPVTLEFRDAPLRSVFEALSRTHGLNFVFDREVRADQRVSLALRDIALDEALRVILVTQQLERKLLNANTLLVYPATVAKQREHAELVTRTLYLTNADAKVVAAMVRTVAKTQDVHIDERLNALVVRDAPAVVRLVEDLVAGLDLPEAEVMIDVEVLEVSSARLDALGLQWPGEIGVGAFDATGAALDSIRLFRGVERDLQARAANPLLLATLRSSDGDTQTLARPTIRARSREKAQVHVGEKLPVFTTTSTANVGVSASVAYLDVGIKLDVEPTVQLDNDVTIKVTLEVSNLLRQVSGPAGSVGYQLGTRRTSTTLRLQDGQTQILAGLTKDDDFKNLDGIPGLARLPWVGRLFGTSRDQRSKTEVVLLMTPRIVRSVPLPDGALSQRAGGTVLNPGAEPLRLSERAGAGVRLASGAAAPAAAPAVDAVAPPLLEIATSGRAVPGETVSVTLRNTGEYTLVGELPFDPTLLRNAASGAPPEQRVLPFELAPGSSQVYVLRVQPAAAGQTVDLVPTVVLATARNGAQATQPLQLSGSGRIEVRDAQR